MKNITKTLLFTICALCIAPAAYAVCPVCVVSVGVLLELANLLGVDISIVGVWSGGLILALYLWTVAWLHKRGINGVFWSIVVPFVVWYGMLASVYLFPNVITFGAQTLWGMDKFLIGVFVGTIAFYIGVRMYARIKRNNGGHAQFPFQKVVVPISLLLIATLVLWGITK